MKRNLIRTGFVVALTISATLGVQHASGENTHQVPQATKQTCC